MNKLIVFDMDGVIIDVSQSYRNTVRETTKLFFSLAAGHDILPDPLFSLADLATVKQSGGLNNDWELTYRVIRLLLTLVHLPKVSDDVDTWEFHKNTIKQCDLAPLTDFLQATDAPLKTLMERHGKSENEFVDRLSDGDVGTGNIIKQIFQEVYLGQTLFEKTYGFEPRLGRDSGFIKREKLLISRDFLEDLSGRHLLAIATGRPKAEADYPLKRFRLRDCFGMIRTLDDCLKEEKNLLKKENRTVILSKPHPFMLDAVADSLEEPVSGYLYIGDMPDDMQAARRAKAPFKGIGITHSAADKAELKRALLAAGADVVIERIEELAEVLE